MSSIPTPANTSSTPAPALSANAAEFSLSGGIAHGAGRPASGNRNEAASKKGGQSNRGRGDGAQSAGHNDQREKQNRARPPGQRTKGHKSDSTVDGAKGDDSASHREAAPEASNRPNTAADGKSGVTTAKRREGGIRIFVKDTAQDRTLSIVIPKRNCTVDDLKFAICKQLSTIKPEPCTSEFVRLIYGGKVLEDDKLISHYSIANDFTVHMLLSSPDSSAAAAATGEATEGTTALPTSEHDQKTVKRSTSMNTFAHKSDGNQMRRSHSLDTMGPPSPSSEKSVVACDALRYVDKKWYRGERGAKSSKGYLVTFTRFRSDGEQDTEAQHIKLCPNWWRSLKEEDMISLEPLSKLKYEPFELPASADKIYWFDGLVLANYLVSSANFVHPVSRRPLERAEMVRLDEYLEKHGLCKGKVAHVFDKKDDSNTNTANHISAMRREASDILGTLFAGGSDASRNRRAQRDRRAAAAQQEPARSGRAAGSAGADERAAAGGGRGQRRGGGGGAGGGAAETRRREEERRRQEEEAALGAAAARLHGAAEEDLSPDEIGPRNQELVREMRLLLAAAEQRRCAAKAAAGAAVADVEAEAAAAADARFVDLRDMSAEFRRGAMPGREYGRQMLELFGYREAGPEARAAVCEMISELIRLLPDRERRRALAAAAAEWMVALAAEQRARRGQTLREAEDRDGPYGAAEGWPAAAAGGDAAAAEEVVVEEGAFPTLDGAAARSAAAAAGVFGGAWSSRPSAGAGAALKFDDPPLGGVTGGNGGGGGVGGGGGRYAAAAAGATRAESGGGNAAGAAARAPPTAEEMFPSLPTAPRPAAGAGQMGAWGGGAGAAADPEPAPAAAVTKKTKRGKLLLSFG